VRLCRVSNDLAFGGGAQAPSAAVWLTIVAFSGGAKRRPLQRHPLQRLVGQRRPLLSPFQRYGVATCMETADEDDQIINDTIEEAVRNRRTRARRVSRWMTG
jgi:hypothetical protein